MTKKYEPFGNDSIQIVCACYTSLNEVRVTFQVKQGFVNMNSLYDVGFVSNEIDKLVTLYIPSVKPGRFMLKLENPNLLCPAGYFLIAAYFDRNLESACYPDEILELRPVVEISGKVSR